MTNWIWSSFEDLSRHDLYQIAKARQQVFIVEQNCPYPDLDDLDPVSWHLIGRTEVPDKEDLLAYARICPPGTRYTEPSIGRVLTTAAARGEGLGKLLMAEAIRRTESLYPRMAIKVSAQHHLERFYTGLGFVTVSDLYDEDGIPHIEMVREGA